jgi:hypothetical protein
MKAGSGVAPNGDQVHRHPSENGKREFGGEG